MSRLTAEQRQSAAGELLDAAERFAEEITTIAVKYEISPEGVKAQLAGHEFEDCLQVLRREAGR